MQRDVKIIICQWSESTTAAGVSIAKILSRSVHVEGLDVCRYLSEPGCELDLDSGDGHIFSLLKGGASLRTSLENDKLTIHAGTHVYLPPRSNARISFHEPSSAIHVAADNDQSRGKNLIVHDEKFLAATRFVLTPQYLSRRAFLHRDPTLASKSGDPIAWFHTTMFDTCGLPPNTDGVEVFKMSYNYQSEVNVVYDVGDNARVRFARHPYGDSKSQRWGEWFTLDGETTYYLNESADGDEVETRVDEVTGREETLRNKHEVYIGAGSHVSLCCLFDPGPTGLETHQPGEYSSYSPVADTVVTPKYRAFLKAVKPIDAMVRSLSLERARDPDRSLAHLPAWSIYEEQLEEARNAQAKIIRSEAEGREAIVERWRI